MISSSSSPNSNLVSARTRPRSRACARAELVEPEREVAQLLVHVGADELDRLARGQRQVVTGLGLRRRREQRLRAASRPAAARRAPRSRRRCPARSYSLQPLPEQVAAHDALEPDRPRRVARASPGPRRRPRSRGSRWDRTRSRGWRTMSAVCSNQNCDTPVSTRPLSGISSGSTTSNTETRSLATISKRSWPTS